MWCRYLVTIMLLVCFLLCTVPRGGAYKS
uniref:Uncharacterized protein n=1 Tax=Arundo donax TaxID=35708 RepID=A0A0A9F2V7_ARUDO